MVRTMHDHSEMSAKELAALLHTTPGAVRHARQRYGRFGKSGLCSVCGKRPVWTESKRAARMNLCKGCFIEETEKRVAEAKAAATMRQHERRWLR